MLRRLQAAAAGAAALTPSYHHTAVAGLVTSSMIRLARDTIFFREIHVVLLLIRDELSPWLKGAQIFMALALRFWCQKSVTFFEFKRQRPHWPSRLAELGCDSLLVSTVAQATPIVTAVEFSFH